MRDKLRWLRFVSCDTLEISCSLRPPFTRICTTQIICLHNTKHVRLKTTDINVDLYEICVEVQFYNYRVDTLKFAFILFIYWLMYMKKKPVTTADNYEQG